MPEYKCIFLHVWKTDKQTFDNVNAELQILCNFMPQDQFCQFLYGHQLVRFLADWLYCTCTKELRKLGFSLFRWWWHYIKFDGSYVYQCHIYFNYSETQNSFHIGCSHITAFSLTSRLATLLHQKLVNYSLSLSWHSSSAYCWPIISRPGKTR